MIMNMRALLPIGILAAIGAVAPMACSTTVSFSAPPGVTGIASWSVPASFGTCSGDEYIALADPTLCGSCTTVAYAYCDGSSYSQCACDAPTSGDWVLEPDPSGDVAGDDGGADVASEVGGEAGDDASSEASSDDAGSDDATSDAASSEAGSDAASSDASTD
jgi:hypothetical protein